MEKETELTAPEVGMGATRYAGTDAYPYTIRSVNASGKKITVSRDVSVRTDTNGLSESQTYVISPDESAAHVEYSKRKDGHFYPVGVPMDGYSMLHIGTRRRYNDPHF